MKQRQVMLVLDSPVLLHLPMMMMMMIGIRLVLAEMYTNLLESLSVRLLAPTCHLMFIKVAF